MGKVKDQLWDEWEAEQKYSDYMDTILDSDYKYDMTDDWILSPTEDMNGIGQCIDITADTSKWYVDADEQILERGLGADVLQKINKKVKEMGGDIIDDEIPF